MIWCSLYLIFRFQASWRHSRPETSTFQWTSSWEGYKLAPDEVLV